MQHDFVTRLRMLRQKRGLSVAAVGRACGRPGPSVYDWESGSGLPGFESLLRLADLYGVSLDYLMRGRGHDGVCERMQAEESASSLPAPVLLPDPPPYVPAPFGLPCAAP